MTMKAMSFQDNISSIPIDKFKDHYKLDFDLFSMEDAGDFLPYPELFGEPMSFELSFTFPPEHVTELIVLGVRISSVAIDKFEVVGKYLKWMDFLSSIFSNVTRYSSIGILVF